jgi:hypothetical protein
MHNYTYTMYIHTIHQGMLAESQNTACTKHPYHTFIITLLDPLFHPYNSLITPLLHPYHTLSHPHYTLETGTLAESDRMILRILYLYYMYVFKHMYINTYLYI